MTLFACLLAASLGGAPTKGVSYHLTPLPETGQMEVTLKSDTPGTVFSIPAWREGDYQLFQYDKAILQPEFLLKGRPVKAVKDSRGRWNIAAGSDEVRYVAIPSGGNFSPNLRVNQAESWVSGPVFGRFEGQERRSILVTITAQPGDSLHLGGSHERSEENASFRASSFSQLMDLPFLLSSKAKTASFRVGAKDHEFVLFGNNQSALPEPFAEASAKIVEQTHRMFGSLPYERYVFFGDVMGGYGGLEHHSCCRLSLWGAAPESALSLIAHEHFHAFNVKAIRPKSLLNPIFMEQPEVRSLWWLEGVTDYYAGVLLVRAGLWRQADFLRDLSHVYWSLERSSAARQVSAEESSLKVWLARGSQGWGGLSYYTKGKGIGFLLDLAIRRESKGERSLDDVMKALYDEGQKGASGYDESRIKELVIEAGGDKLKGLFEAMVERPDPMPWDDLLTSFGMKLERQAIVLNRDATDEARRLCASWPLATK